MSFHPHPYLKDSDFLLICKLHDAFDTALSLHYSSHTALLTAHSLFRMASDAVQRRVKVDHFVAVLRVDNNAYKVVPPTGVKDYSPCYVTLFEDINAFNKSLQDRKTQFVDKMNQWIDAHQGVGYISGLDMAQFLQLHAKDTKGDTKSASPQRVQKPRLSLKNDASKFAFKEKVASVEKAKSGGLSLMERIKLKEAKLKESEKQETPEETRYKRLCGKLVPVYNVVSQLAGEQDKLVVFPLSKLSNTIKDSMNYPLGTDDIIDILKIMEKKLTKDQIKDKTMNIVTRSNMSVVKIIKLNRQRDLELLQ